MSAVSLQQACKACDGAILQSTHALLSLSRLCFT